MKKYKSLLNNKKIPKHIAIIMDGNGRWAKKKSLRRIEGHKQGSEVIEPLIDAAMELGIKAISLYAFSTENWIRPKTEIKGLWELVHYFFDAKREIFESSKIRVMHSGSLKGIPKVTQNTIKEVVDHTKKNKDFTLNLCINYGGRQDIIQAVNTWLENRKGDKKLTMKSIEKYLYTNSLPQVDLLIRTSGEYRISNYLLWQIAYSELVFTDVLWPDFSPNHLYQSIYEFQQRERRYGGI